LKFKDGDVKNASATNLGWFGKDEFIDEKVAKLM